MRTSYLAALCLGAVSFVGFAKEAQAKLFELYVEAGVGGGVGKGLSGDQKEADFFEGAGGPGYGAILGAEVFFVDVAIEHDQFLDGEGVNGTWTAFTLGFDVDVDLGDGLSMELGIGVGYGIGTGQQVMPPLDNSEITDKGLLAQARFNIDYRLSDTFSFGVTLPVTWGYLTKNGPGLAVNDEANNYTSLSTTPLLYLRFRIEPFADDEEGEGEGEKKADEGE
jgi:hypothetical protein